MRLMQQHYFQVALGLNYCFDHASVPPDFNSPRQLFANADYRTVTGALRIPR